METTTAGDISPLGSTRWIWITRRARIAGHGPIVRAVFHVLRARRCASMQRWGIILVTENTTDCPPKGSEFWKGKPGWDLRKCQENPKVGEIYIIIWPESCQPCPPAGSGPVIIRIRTYTVRKGPSEDSYWVRLLGSLLDHGIKVTGATKSRSLDFILCQPGQKLYISFGFLQLAFKRYNSPEKNG